MDVRWTTARESLLRLNWEGTFAVPSMFLGSFVMPNFGIPRRATADLRMDAGAVNWRRGLFRIWILISAGWIMGWTIYLMLEGVQGSFTTRGDFVEIPILLFAPPIALWLFGFAAAWAARGFEAER
jgi:hypothetical protein